MSVTPKDELQRITERIIERSKKTRAKYLAMIQGATPAGKVRSKLSCTNLAHDYAASTEDEKIILRQQEKTANIGIISSYNDILSAHQPFVHFPALIKQSVAQAGHIAQFAGGVPAMCDGVTQGQTGMELSLFSRDIIAQSAAIALSHQLFDAVIMLGICDKIAPGLLIAALRFGHLPTIFIPSGPMPSGIPNKEKALMREAYAQGKATRDQLLETELASYHAPGTCTFYGTANSNQLVLEIMGLQLPGSAFEQPNTALRHALTVESCRKICDMAASPKSNLGVGHLVNEKVLVNGIVGLLASGGSTNLSIHLIAVAAAAGIIINWDDFAALSKITPLIAKVYPNGEEDINRFHAQGGTAYLIHSLLSEGLLHDDVNTVLGGRLSDYTTIPTTENSRVIWQKPAYYPAEILKKNKVITDCAHPFKPSGGLALVQGNLGRAIVKTSAVDDSALSIRAPAVVFESQSALKKAVDSGQLDKDFVAVVRYQGPAANGMPELHKLIPYLNIQQKKGYKVALVTDGRLSGASGSVLAAIHLTPEAIKDGLLGLIENGDIIEIDSKQGILNAVPLHSRFEDRESSVQHINEQITYGNGRELFTTNRRNVTDAESGATTFGF